MGNRILGIAGVLLFVGGLGLSFAIPDVDKVEFLSAMLVMTIGAALFALLLRRSWIGLGAVTQRIALFVIVAQTVVTVLAGWIIKDQHVYTPLLLVALISAIVWGAMSMWSFHPLTIDQHSAKR